MIFRKTRVLADPTSLSTKIAKELLPFDRVRFHVTRYYYELIL